MSSYGRNMKLEWNHDGEEDVQGFEVGLAIPKRQTKKAVQMLIDGIGREWVPKSSIHDDSEVWRPGQPKGRLIVNEWFAEKKGWIR